MITISIILQRWKKKRIIVSVRLDERYQKRILKFINRVHVGVSSCNLVLELIGQVCLIINPYNKFARLLLTCITHGNNTFNNLLWLGIFILGSIRWREILFFSQVFQILRSPKERQQGLLAYFVFLISEILIHENLKYFISFAFRYGWHYVAQFAKKFIEATF